MKKPFRLCYIILSILFISILIVSCTVLPSTTTTIYTQTLTVTPPELQSQILSLQGQLSSANSQIISLQTQLVSTHSQILSLQNQLSSSVAPPYIIMKSRQAKWVFNNLDNQTQWISFDEDTLESNVVAGTFMRSLSIADMNLLKLTSLSQRFTNGSKILNLDGQFTCLDCSPYIQSANFKNIADDINSSYTDDASKIKEVWNMVTQLCPYTDKTTSQTPRLPLETLLFGGGDCKDLAILTASILRGISPSWAVQLVYMDANNPTGYKCKRTPKTGH